MNDELKQHISEFLDDELDHAASLDLLQTMQKNPELINALNRYATISQALKSNQFSLVAADFQAKIAAQIEQEAFYLIPQRKRKAVKHHYKIIALAASLAVIAVISTRSLDNPTTRPIAANALQLAQQSTSQKTELPVDKQLEAYPLNARINDYLQAHNNSIYTDGQADFRPLAKVTAYNSRK